MQLLSKVMVALLLVVMPIRADTIDISGTGYQFEYDSKVWNMLPKSTEGLWSFSDHLLYLDGGVVLGSGSSDGVTAEQSANDMAEVMGDGYGQVKEDKSISGLKTFRASRKKDKKEIILCCLVDKHSSLFIFIEGDAVSLTLRKSTVRAFLSGLSKKK
ncbi:MAG: hypothetical protein ABIT76_09805 [Chthoniobacterales bacterium]